MMPDQSMQNRPATVGPKNSGNLIVTFLSIVSNQFSGHVNQEYLHMIYLKKSYSGGCSSTNNVLKVERSCSNVASMAGTPDIEKKP